MIISIQCICIYFFKFFSREKSMIARIEFISWPTTTKSQIQESLKMLHTMNTEYTLHKPFRFLFLVIPIRQLKLSVNDDQHQDLSILPNLKLVLDYHLHWCKPMSIQNSLWQVQNYFLHLIDVNRWVNMVV